MLKKSNDNSIKIICRLLRIDEAMLRTWLCNKRIKTVNEVVNTPLPLDQVHKAYFLSLLLYFLHLKNLTKKGFVCPRCSGKAHVLATVQLDCCTNKPMLKKYCKNKLVHRCLGHLRL